MILPNTLLVIINKHQVKHSVALDFMLDVLSVVKTEKGTAKIWTGQHAGPAVPYQQVVS